VRVLNILPEHLQKGEAMKFLIYVALAGLLAACGTAGYQGKGPAGSDRPDYSNSQMDCQKIARRMNDRMDLSAAMDKCSQEKADTPRGG
jgi:hypothetical protein